MKPYSPECVEDEFSEVVSESRCEGALFLLHPLLSEAYSQVG